MEKWAWICLLLSAFAFFKKLRPSEPYDVKYLVDYKNISRDAIIHDAFPVSTYTWFAMLPVVFLLTSILRYRPLIYVEALAILSIFILMLWAEGLPALMVVEFLYGLSMSTEVASQTYIYAKVAKEHFRVVTSYTLSATFLGTFVSAITAQVLVSFELFDLRQLHYLSLGGVTVAVVLAFLLPPAPPLPTPSPRTFLDDLTAAYRNPYVLKWAVWWAVEKAGNFQVVAYHKSMLEEIDPGADEDQVFNGALQAAQCVFSVSLSIGLAHTKIRWERWGEGLVSLVSLTQGLALFALSRAGSVFPAYGLILLYRILHQVTSTVGSAEIALHINPESHGLIFGLNVFVAAGLQVILTLVLSELELGIRTQFLIFAGYSLGLGLVFLLLTCRTAVRKCGEPRRKSTETKSGSNQISDAGLKYLDSEKSGVLDIDFATSGSEYGSIRNSIRED